MISEETQIDVLAEISRNLNRIATALETFNKACVRDNPGGPDHVEIFATTHQL